MAKSSKTANETIFSLKKEENPQVVTGKTGRMPIIYSTMVD
jgi:hypothetical protein